mmetsp:Transcript_31447/g.61753  ORF Transcript_31447/g.61753 Transcript_31447/m.61753 type:complete len:195 (-) Transcript_31447:127-711(-)
MGQNCVQQVGPQPCISRLVTPKISKDSANCHLLRASTDGNLDGILRALDAGASVNTRLPTWFRAQSAYDDSDAEGDAVVNFGPPIAATSKYLTPLMHASRQGHVQAVHLLLEEKASVHLREMDGMRPLHFAAAGGSRDCCELLLQARADPHLVDDHDRDPYLCLPLEKLHGQTEQQAWKTLLREGGKMARSVSF